MPARKQDKRPRPHDKSASGVGPPAADKNRPTSKALPNGAQRSDTGQPGGGQGRVDVTGTMPEGIRVDPDITEGQPGYQESGESEIIPTERVSGGQAAKEKESRG